MAKRLLCIAAGLLLAVSMLPMPGTTPSHAAGPTAAPTSSQTLLAIACPSVNDCYAGGENGALLATRDGGATWQPQPYQALYRPGVTTIVSIACPAVNDCFAQVQAGCEDLGAHVPFLHTTDGGKHWITTSIQGCGSSLACPNVTTCYTIISPTGPGTPAIVRTTNGGGSWQVQSRIDPNALLGSLSCPTSTTCYLAFRNAVERSTDGGRHWAMSHMTAQPCPPPLNGCPGLYALACPALITCYAGGSESQHGRLVPAVITTTNGFRSETPRQIPGLDDISALACPSQNVCGALGGPYASQSAITTDGAAHWRVGRITTPYPFRAFACASASVCYATGYLGRVMGTRDGGATWHDLIPAIFVSGTYGARQPAHTFSPWFTATGPWRLAVGKLSGPLGPNLRPLPASCRGIDTVAVYVRNSQGQIVAGPVRDPGREDRVTRTTVQVTGKLRLDVQSRCSSLSVRVDGVERSQA